MIPSDVKDLVKSNNHKLINGSKIKEDEIVNKILQTYASLLSIEFT